MQDAPKDGVLMKDSEFLAHLKTKISRQRLCF